MVYRPRTTDEIYESLRNSLTANIGPLTNFVETSFNYIWTRAFSDRFRDNEVALFAAQMSGWVDYAGGPVTQEQLDALDIDGLTPEEVNQYMNDEDLENLVGIVGIDRDPGERATGQVTFTTVSSFTQIPEGTSVATQPDADGDFFEYTTDEQVETASGDTDVSVSITADDFGEEYNVGSGQVTYMPSPPNGVQGVTNEKAILGGANEETNEELRARAKNAIFDKSGGGTASGVRGYVRSNTEDVTSVSVAEYPGGNASLEADSPSPGGPGGSSSTTPFADVIVEGGTTEAVQQSIEEARPVSIQHNLVRPNLIEVNIDVQVTGSAVDTSDIQSAVTAYINGLDLGETVYRDRLVQRILNASAQVDSIEELTVSVSNESYTYQSGTDVYNIRKGVQMKNDGITDVTGTLSGTQGFEFTEGTDYNEVDDDGDGSDDSIDWSVGGDKPDDGTDFFVTYEVQEDIPIDQYEKGDTNSVSVSVV